VASALAFVESGPDLDVASITIEGKATTMATRTKTSENGGTASARGSKRSPAVSHLSVAERIARGKGAK
jgi:hypothetical protein